MELFHRALKAREFAKFPFLSVLTRVCNELKALMFFDDIIFR